MKKVLIKNKIPWSEVESEVIEAQEDALKVVNSHIEIEMKVLERELHDHLDKEKEKYVSELDESKRVRMQIESELSAKAASTSKNSGEVDRYKRLSKFAVSACDSPKRPNKE